MPSQPITLSSAIITLISALVITFLTGFTKTAVDSKLDTARYVSDSTTRWYQRRDDLIERHDDRVILLRMDSTLRLICAKISCKPKPSEVSSGSRQIHRLSTALSR